MKKFFSVFLSVLMLTIPTLQTTVVAVPAAVTVDDSAFEAETTHVHEHFENTADDECVKQKQKEVAAEDEALLASEKTFSNDYLRVIVKDNRFVVYTTGGNPNSSTDNNKKLLYDCTSRTDIKIDGVNQTYSSSNMTISADGTSCVSTMTIGDVLVTQTFTLQHNTYTQRADVVEFRYDLKNNSNVTKELGGFIMFDTMLGGNDQAPFKIPGVGDVTYEREYTGNQIPQYWQCFDSLTNPSVVASGTLYRNASQKPDKVQFLRYSHASWSYATSPSTQIGDSSVAVYFNPISVAGGETRTFATWYGLSDLSEIETVGEVSFRLTGTVPELPVNEDQTAYTDNPFTLTAYVENTNQTSKNISMTLNVPSELTVIGSTTKTVTVGAESETSVNWEILANPQYTRKTVTYSVTMSVDGEETTQEQTIVLPALRMPFDIVLDRHAATMRIGDDSLPIIAATNPETLNHEVDFVWTVSDESVVCLADGVIAVDPWVPDAMPDLEEIPVVGDPIFGDEDVFIDAVFGFLSADIVGVEHTTASTKYIVPVGEGTATIRVSTPDGEIYDECVVTVTERECEHNTFGEWVVEEEPTCTESGSKYRVCTACGEERETSVIPATGHDYESEVTKEATCTEDGEITYTCKNCDESYRLIVHTEHEYEMSVYEATCTEDGAVVYTCNKCGDSNSEIIPASHDYVSEITKKSTKTETGIITYTCSKCGDSYTEEIPMLGEGGNVLLIQDRIPWTIDSNIMLLRHLLEYEYITSYDIVTVSQAKNTNLYDYSLILIANDQTTSIYNNLSTINEQLTLYAQNGGVIIYGACDNGWAAGDISYRLPGGVSKIENITLYNYIVDSSHPIVTGSMTDGKPLTNQILYGTYCSHSSFDESTLPEGYNVILQDGRGNPTLAEYPMGDGFVIASGLTWEFYYVREFSSNGTNTTYSKNVFDDMIVYALSLSGVEICEHIYDEGVITEPGCLTDGYITYTCTKCGKTNIVSYMPATGHEYDQWTVETTATCVQSGSKYRDCVICDEGRETAIIDALGHDYEVSDSKAPSCTESGYTEYKCQRIVGGDICSHTYREIILPIGHDYEITETVEPTCLEDGYIVFECQRAECDVEKVQTLMALGHTFGNDNVCDRCGYVLINHDHEYEEEIVEPTCTEVGYTIYTCYCGHTYRSDYIEQKGHDFDEGEIIEDKTCTTEGEILYVCMVCECEKYEKIPASHNWSEEIITEATCTEDGEKVKTCLDCGAEETEIIPAGHAWETAEIVDEPTCTASGLEISKCSVCGEIKEFEISPLGHEFVDGVCIRCGATIEDVIVESAGSDLYGMYFKIKDIVSDYGPSLIDEYGVLLDYNPGAQLDKVAVYLTQDGRMWRRAIACVGDNITHATYVPYLAYRGKIKYTGLNHDWINIFRLSENIDGIWEYGNYTTIGVNLEDAYGNLLLTLSEIGQAGRETRIFTDLDEMIAWLKSDACAHNWNSGIVTKNPTCTEAGFKTYTCENCGKSYQEGIAPLGHDFEEWHVIIEPTQNAAGEETRTCIVCDYEETREIDKLSAAIFTVSNAQGRPGDTIKIDIYLTINGAFNTVGFSGIEYDSDYFTFVNATVDSNFRNMCALTKFDKTKKSLVAALKLENDDGEPIPSPTAFDGKICTLTFKINENAPECETEISITNAQVKLYSDTLESSVVPATVSIVQRKTGDLTGDETVDISDAILLLQHSMFPDLYPLDYFGSVDFSKDGLVDINDAILLLQHSMFPDLYPIE